MKTMISQGTRLRFAAVAIVTVACVAGFVTHSAYANSAVGQPSVVFSNIGEVLDGDYAFISDVGLVNDDRTESCKAISTGTAPWDDNSTNPGCDSTSVDNVVRSFDIVNYTTYFKSSVYNDAPCVAYKTGTLHFEFVLEGSKSQVQFETGSMGWLAAKKNATYELSEKTVNGTTYQVLSGSYLWEPNEDNPSAIGNSYQELNVAIRVLAMTNGQRVQPIFTFWLEGNNVAENGLARDSAACEQHGVVEPKTVETPAITVTTAPRFNVQLKTCDTRAQYIDAFDFSTGNEKALSKNAGSLYGRADVLGIALQVVGKAPEYGLRGCELPNGDSITFDVDLSSVYREEDGTEHGATTEFAPKVWSLDANVKSNSQQDGREIAGTYKFAVGGAPSNQGVDYASCMNGGMWSGDQNGSKVSITVSGYDFSTSQLPPYGDAGVNASICTYYNPMSVANYWEVQTACFSAGELWVVQPFYNEAGEYVVDKYGTGGFTFTASAVNLRATGESGQALDRVGDNTNQANVTDDFLARSMPLEKPGSIDQGITYQQYGKIEYGTSLTDGCFENGKDWIAAGGSLNIQELLKHNTAEGRYTAVAYDDLMKFDDAFFEIESVSEGSSAGLENMERKFLYGAKPDKTGWDHKGLGPAEEGYDEEMVNATADNLVFFGTLDELRAQGYVCCAVLWEARGIASPQSTNCYIGIQGHVAQTAQADAVYMVTHSAKAWSKGDVTEIAARELNLDAQALTDDDYKAYAQSSVFPTRENAASSLTYANYPDSFWTNDAAHNNGLKNYMKAVYDASGYVDGSAGVSNGDSCLVVAYFTTIAKTVEQRTAAGATKLSYDLDANQRIADYALSAQINRNAGESTTADTSFSTKVNIEDTLAAGLSYVPGSAVLGGTYSQTGEGKRGDVEGGVAFEPSVAKNDDGTTTLSWVIDDVRVGSEETTLVPVVHYSCSIGTPGIEDTDARNNDQLLNSAKVWGSAEQRHDFTAAAGNMAEISIQVSKNNAVSLVKVAETPLVEAGSDMSFVLNVGNNAANPLDIVAVDNLPYNGDPRTTSVHGDVSVKRIEVLNGAQFSDVTLYCTENEGLRDMPSLSLDTTAFQACDWFKLNVGSDGIVDMPGSAKPVSIAAVGTIPANSTLKVRVTMGAPNSQPGDHVVNHLTRGDLESDASVSMVSRSLEGVVWCDANEDGVRQTDEAKINGVAAHLLVLKAGGDASNIDDYEPYTVDGSPAIAESGRQLNVATDERTDYSDGRYKFTGLPAGTFAVLFDDGTFSLFGYTASPVDEGSDDTLDSDAAALYSGVSPYALVRASIVGIDMPRAEDMATVQFNSPYHDFGVYLGASVPDTGMNSFAVAVVAVVAIGLGLAFAVARGLVVLGGGAR